MRVALVVVALSACGGSSRPALPAEPAPAPGPAPAAEAPPAPPPVVDATPDRPSGEAAKRDAELARLAAPIFELTSNSSVQWARDGKHYVFMSTRDGLPQLYLGEVGKPEAKRLVTSQERVTSPRVLADGNSVVFRSDRGADENWRLWRVGLDGTGLTELTPDKRQRDLPILADGAPGQVFYSARALTDQGSTLYATSSAAPGEEKVLYKDELPGHLTDVSRDGKWALYLQTPSGNENHLLLVDLTKGTSEVLYPRTGTVAIGDASFTADGKRVLVSSDGGGQQSLLLGLDPRTGKELARYVEQQPATATIGSIVVARRGNLIAVDVDAGNHDDIRVLDATTLRPRGKLTVPLGSGGVNDFTPDGKRLALVWSTPNAPANVFTLDVASGKLATLRQDPQPALQGLPAIEASIAEAAAFDGGKIPLNVYLPAGANGKLPVIVNYHGGPSSSSTVGWSPITRFFLSQGYAWVEPNVRGSAGFGRAYEMGDDGQKRLDAFKDIEAAGKWVAAQPWADPSRLVIYGGSYGGYTVLVGLTRQQKLWRAGVDLVGVANLATFMATTSGLIHKLFLVEFGDPDKDAAFLDSISPLRDAGKIERPLFVYAGANDPRVPRSESDLIVKAVRQSRVPVEYMLKENEGHSLAHRETQIEFASRVARFLEGHLK